MIIYTLSTTQVVVLGTPAEEAVHGKVHLLQGGAFDDAAIALMAHPTPLNEACPSTSALLRVLISLLRTCNVEILEIRIRNAVILSEFVM